jgi:hypothetical protein
MNLDEWENIIGIGTGIWFIWFVIEFLAIDYNSLCFEDFGNNTLCFQELFLILPDFMYDFSEKISMLILGFFVFDLGYRCGKIGWNGFIHDKQNILDIIITIPFFWIVEPWAFMRMLRMLKVVKLILKIYQAIKKGQRIKQNKKR